MGEIMSLEEPIENCSDAKTPSSKLGKLSEVVEGVLQLVGQPIHSSDRIQTGFSWPASELGVCNGNTDRTDS